MSACPSACSSPWSALHAVNEVVRVQDLTKQLGYPLLATAPFARSRLGTWHPLGEHLLRGFETPMPILTMTK